MRANKAVLSVSNVSASYSTDGTDMFVTVAGTGSPAGADVEVTITFDDTEDEFFGSATVNSSGNWTTDPIDVLQESGSATVEADVTSPTFPGLMATCFANIVVPTVIVVFRRTSRTKSGTTRAQPRVRAK